MHVYHLFPLTAMDTIVLGRMEHDFLSKNTNRIDFDWYQMRTLANTMTTAKTDEK